ncbi:hypothetical protein NXX23_13450 [Bacteroides ovatus]|nr:hypothetical protein [Bacteroides ovatus]
MQGVKKTDSKGKTYYQGSVSYTLKIVDPSNGTLKGTQTFTHEGLTGNIGDTPDEAIIKTLDYVVISMDDFVDEYFKMKGTIVQIESTKKDKAQTVYIDLGTKRGVQKVTEIYRLHRDGYCRRTVIERSRTLECERSIERNTFFMYREQRR